MKIFLLAVTLLGIAGCAGKLELPKAKAVVEALIQKTDKEDYNGISQFYTDELNTGEPTEARTEKLKKLKQILGDIKSFELIESKNETYNDFPALKLTYRVKHTKRTSVQEFTVIKDAGEYKIARQNIQSVN